MLYVVIGLVLFIAVLLMVVVLAQEPKGNGITKEFGGAGANQIMGAKNTSNIMEKITWSLVSAVFIGSIAATLMTDVKPPNYQSPNIEKAKEQISDIPTEGTSLTEDDLVVPTEETPSTEEEQ